MPPASEIRQSADTKIARLPVIADVTGVTTCIARGRCRCDEGDSAIIAYGAQSVMAGLGRAPIPLLIWLFSVRVDERPLFRRRHRLTQPPLCVFITIGPATRRVRQSGATDAISQKAYAFWSCLIVTSSPVAKTDQCAVAA